MKIARKYHLPVISSFGDDYYSIPTSWSHPIIKLQSDILKHKINQFVNFSNYVLTINKTFSEYYKAEFKISERIEPLYMGASIQFDSGKCRHRLCGNALILSFIGNQSLGRWENLLEIGRTLDQYNTENQTEHCLKVYGSILPEFEKESSKISSIRVMGRIQGSDVKDAILTSDVLIHTESFKNEYINQTRFSLSTKIADSLSSGKLLLAYGPKQVASMQHLIENTCAYCIVEKRELCPMLFEMLKKQNEWDKIIAQEINVAKEYHNTPKNSNRMRNVVENVINQYKN